MKKEIYVAPESEEIEVRIECNFAQSPGGNGNEQLDPDIPGGKD